MNTFLSFCAKIPSGLDSMIPRFVAAAGLCVAIGACDSNDEDTSDTSDGSDMTSSMTGEDTGPDDGDNNCLEIACHPGMAGQCGAGQKCSPFVCGDSCCTNATKCVPATGERQLNETCMRNGAEGTDDCADTLYCMPDSAASGGSGPGICMQLCIPEPDEYDHCSRLGVPGAHCFNWNDGTLPLCEMPCDPLNPDCEGENQGCYLGLDNFICMDMDLQGSPGTPGTLCNTEQACLRGLACVPKELFESCENPCPPGEPVCGCCAYYCDVIEDDGACEVNEECVQIFENPGPGRERVGFCVTPL